MQYVKHEATRHTSVSSAAPSLPVSGTRTVLRYRKSETIVILGRCQGFVLRDTKLFTRSTRTGLRKLLPFFGSFGTEPKEPKKTHITVLRGLGELTVISRGRSMAKVLDALSRAAGTDVNFFLW